MNTRPVSLLVLLCAALLFTPAANAQPPAAPSPSVAQPVASPSPLIAQPPATPSPSIAQTVVVPVVAAAPTGTLQALHGERLTYFSILTLVIGYLATTLIGAFGFVILWRMFTGRIDLTLLISESNGSASLSRFQFLVFTFVISLSLLLVILGAKDGPGFPETIPIGIYALLGISAASYVVSKSIQSGTDKARDDGYRVSPNDPNVG